MKTNKELAKEADQAIKYWRRSQRDYCNDVANCKLEAERTQAALDVMTASSGIIRLALKAMIDADYTRNEVEPFETNPESLTVAEVVNGIFYGKLTDAYIESMGVILGEK